MSLIKKIVFLLIGDYRRQAVFLVLMMIIGTLLEVAGIGLVIPVLGFLVDNNAMIENQLVQSILPNNIDLSEVNFLLWGMSILVIVYIVKTIYLTYLSWRISKTVYGLEEKISKELYKKYLNQSFAFHLEHNSGQLIQNVSGEVNQLASILMGGLNLIAEIFVVLGVAILLLIIEPFGALFSMCVLVLLCTSMLLSVKSKIIVISLFSAIVNETNNISRNSFAYDMCKAFIFKHCYFHFSVLKKFKKKHDIFWH